MKLTAQDWQKLQLPLLTLGVSIVIAGLLFAASDARRSKVQQALQIQQNALSQARQRYETSGQEKDNIVKYLPSYQLLIQRGFVGEEQRVRWISDLRDINQRYKLFGVSYDIGAQQEAKPMQGVSPGNFKLHRSTMKINFAMLHEYDLLTLLQALQSGSNPPFILRECVITRVTTGKHNKFVPNLSTQCELDWLTISEPVIAGAKP